MSSYIVSALQFGDIFADLSYAAGLLYAVIGSFSILFSHRVLMRDTGKCCSITCLIPKTAQHQVHVLIFLLCLTRFIFFFLAPFSWDEVRNILYSSIL
jgi:hypothetical protein